MEIEQYVKQRVGYRIQRDIMDEFKVDELAEKSEVHTPMIKKIKESIRCSGPCVKSCFLSCIPLLSWLPRYPLRENAFGDLVSGISVGIMHLPQGMAYALLAAVPPVFGLYSSFYPILLYFIFGSSKHISVGTYAVMSVMIGSVTERMAPDSDFMMFSNSSNSSVIDTVTRDNERVKIAAAVTCLSGIFQLLLGLVQFGFVVTYLSEPLVRAYTTAASIHVIVSQIKYTFGINPNRYSGPLSLIYTVLDACSLLGGTNIGTLVVSIVTIIGLIIAKEINTFLSRKLPVPLPVELFAIIIATVVSWRFDFKTLYNVDVVGTIPSGLQAPVLPEFSMMGSMIGDAFALAVVGYGIAISLGRIFALKYGYKVDSNQELIAFGLSNSIGGVFQCFAISCSMSRTMVQISTGGKTQVAGALSALVMLVILLKIGELFEELPKAVLAAVIYVNLHGMLKQFGDIRILWRSNKVDMLVWVMTFIFTVLLNPDLGLAASIAFSMLTVIFRTQLPKYSLLGQIPGTDIYKPIEDYNKVTQIPGLVIFRCSATLYFANAEMYTEHLYEKSGVDVPKLLSRKKKLEAKRLRKEKKEAKRAKKQAKREASEMSDNEDRYEVAVVMSPEFDQHSDPTIPKAIILDLSPVNFLDTVGVKTLRNIHKDFGEAGINVFISGCQRCVTDSLEKGDFFNDKVTKAILFTTVHDAVLHYQEQSIQEPKLATHF
ncbi:solute carrier family 26 member 6-like [Tachysurus vachellii]|uniref:solute carrier family 26 member 6-like n=1 Tax=Tachysurus vachellii TaxID=175792 RepID=UPI00296B080D|nr:solute carrier family 26 member 6-like [Tachysurus vachellii]XP_060737733.1 solute carrier family 26 member 6-like [Tachysurus vachellii]XP_060737734.1 solute carrier family 26 member 6-like [Tachysurus vachellii]